MTHPKPTRIRPTAPYDVLQVRRFDWRSKLSDPWASQDGWEALSTLRTPDDIRTAELAVETGYVGCIGNADFRITSGRTPIYFLESPLPVPAAPRGPVYF